MTKNFVRPGTTTVAFDIEGDEPVPMLAFERVEFHRDGSRWECRFTVAGSDVANIRIPQLTIHHVVAAMAAAARAAFKRAEFDMPVHDYRMTVSKD